MPRVTIRPLRIATHPFNNSLVVLIHGILSSRYSAWAPAIDMIQTLYEKGERSSAFGTYDFYAFGYESSWKQPTFPECFDALRDLVSRDQYNTVILIGHSQGGVLAKLFLIHELQNGRGDTTNVDVVITLDTPHRGPQLWIYPAVLFGAAWKRLPLLKRVPLFRQASDLGYFSDNMKLLRTYWNATLFPQTVCEPTPTRRHLRSYTISGTVLPGLRTKLVVPDRSANGFAIDEPIAVPRAERIAWGVGHGVAAMKNYRFQIERLLSDYCLDSIAETRTQLAAVPDTVLSQALEMTCHAAALGCEVESWRRRLARAFEERPLRKIGGAAALRKLVELRLKHP